MLQIKIINTEDAFRSIELEWNNLLEKSKSKSPFLTYEWIHTWWKMLKNKNEELFIIGVIKETYGLVALAPFLIKRERKFGTNFRIIEFIGADERTSADYLDLIVHPDLTDEVAKSLLNYLTKEEAIKWDVINMSGILKDSTAFKISQYLTDGGYEVYEELMDVCPYMNLPETWEEYLSILSKKSRYNVRKKRRTLDAAYKNRFYIITDSHAIKPAMESTGQLHKKRMQMKGIAGFSMTNDFWAFQLEVAKQFFKKGWLFLGILEVNGSPVASQYGFKFDNKLLHYQTGLDPGYDRYSVGLISTGDMIKNAIGLGFKEYDFLRGREDYKFHWTKHERQTFSVYTVNKNYRGRFLLTKLKFLNNVKKGIKDLLGKISLHRQL